MRLVLIFTLLRLMFLPLDHFSTPIQQERLAPAGQAALMDPAEVQAFLDGVIAAQRETYHLPGAAISVVQGDRLIVAKGYGYADVDQQIPVSADQTLFRMASVSKLFVWTAVMQLVEQGRLDLNADVNTYLKDFKIPATYPQPVTLAHLMTHTPGFEERSLGTSAQNVQDVQPLGSYLANHMPARVRPPGELTAYSNYGAALAGYIVSQVSGEPFDQYVEAHIFKPLKMQHSTFQQPLPQGLAANLAIGYRYQNGAFVLQAAEWSQLAPAAALSATASDMANFMLAHLQDGRFEDSRILQAATAQEMHQQNFTNDPRVGGYAHGFSVASVNHQRILMHGGDILNYHSALVLLPEHGVGIFVVYNSADGMPAVLNTLRAFMDHYFPDTQPALDPAAGLNEPLERYAGVYIQARNEYTTAGKMVGMLQSIKVTPAGGMGSQRELVVALGFPAQVTWRYIEVEPGVFRSTDSPPAIFGDLVFRLDQQGQAQALFQQNNPTTAYLRAPFYASPLFNVILLGVCLLLFLSVLFWLPVEFWLRRRFQVNQPAAERLAGWFQVLVCVLSLFFITGFMAVFSNPQVVYGLPAWAYTLFWLPVIIAVLALVLLIYSILAWRRGFWSLPGRIHYTMVSLGGLAFVWWLAYWNLWAVHLY